MFVAWATSNTPSPPKPFNFFHEHNFTRLRDGGYVPISRMGNYSFFITHAHADECLVCWETMDAASLSGDWRLEEALKATMDASSSRHQPSKTLADVGRLWNETKFYGYWNDKRITALRELSRNLTMTNNNVAPRLFFTHEDNDDVICLEFVPGRAEVRGAAWNPHTCEDEYECNWMDKFPECKAIKIENIREHIKQHDWRTECI